MHTHTERAHLYKHKPSNYLQGIKIDLKIDKIDIKIDLKEVEWEGLDWIHLAQDRDKWRLMQTR